MSLKIVAVRPAKTPRIILIPKQATPPKQIPVYNTPTCDDFYF
jgi:hypothetical protein